MNIITGMHRSGTSAIARLFYESGIDMGSRDTFYRPDQWNPEGYFEQPDIQSINIPLINGPWGKFSYLRLPSEETITKRAQKISEKISAAAQKYRGKLVKETRFCLTFNAWQEHGAGISKVLACLREPIQVAQSLYKRNRLPIGHALNLWYEHYKRLMLQTQKTAVWFIDYNHLMEENQYDKEIKAAFDFFSYSLSGEETQRLWKTFVKPEMNHHTTSSFPYSVGIKTLWRELSEKHKKQFS